MYPYVSAATAAAHHHHQQQAAAAAAFGAAAATGSMVPGGFPSSASTAALAAAAAVDAAAADKSCRYTAGLAGNVAPTDSMVNYTLGHHHQNGAAVSAASSVSAASASMAVAAQFYHQAASAVVDPLNSCSQPTAPGGQPIPDIPRYPWMSITGTNIYLYLNSTCTFTQTFLLVPCLLNFVPNTTNIHYEPYIYSFHYKLSNVMVI